MALYVPEYEGYIADVPNLLFERCDGKRFYFDELDSFSATQNANVLTINGGQSNFPLAQIDTDKTFELTFGSAKFTLAMFEMANAADIHKNDIGVLDGGLYEVEAGLKITLPFETQENSIYIAGMEQDSTAAAGKFSVAVTAATAQADGATVITFVADDVTAGDTVLVTYRRRVVNGQVVDINSNSTTARGSVSVLWPIYSSGTDCTEASQKGQLILEISRVRVTALPGFSNSYKQNSVNEITVSAMDPKRADRRVARYIYEKFAEDGGIVAKSGETVDWD